MPASKVTFTAVWKDKEEADYAVQFWAEKSDHADGASLLDKYDYMGTRVYKDKDTGSRPVLDTEPVNGLKFPDLDQARLNKIWNGDKFNRGRDLYLNKFFVYNKELTDKENEDQKNQAWLSLCQLQARLSTTSTTTDKSTTYTLQSPMHNLKIILSTLRFGATTRQRENLSC